MRSKILIARCQVVFLTLVVLYVSPITAHTQSMEEQLSGFIYSDEFKAPEFEKLRNLPKEAVVVLATTLNKKSIGEVDELRVYKCLATKFIQHEDELSTSDRDIAIEALLTKLGSTSLADRSFRVNALKGVKAPQLLRVVQGEAKNAAPRTGPNQSINEASSPVNTTSTMSVKPAAAPLADTPDQQTKSTAPATPPQSSRAADTKSTPWPWIIGAILLLAVVGGVFFKFLHK